MRLAAAMGIGPGRTLRTQRSSAGLNLGLQSRVVEPQELLCSWDRGR